MKSVPPPPHFLFNSHFKQFFPTPSNYTKFQRGFRHNDRICYISKNITSNIQWQATGITPMEWVVQGHLEPQKFNIWNLSFIFGLIPPFSSPVFLGFFCFFSDYHCFSPITGCYFDYCNKINCNLQHQNYSFSKLGKFVLGA